MAESQVKLLPGNELRSVIRMEMIFVLMKVRTGLPRHMCMFSSCAWKTRGYTCS